MSADGLPPDVRARLVARLARMMLDAVRREAAEAALASVIRTDAPNPESVSDVDNERAREALDRKGIL